MVWCGVVWCGVVWCGVVWCGVVWCGVVWCGVVWCGMVWYGMCGMNVLMCGETIVVTWIRLQWHQPTMRFQQTSIYQSNGTKERMHRWLSRYRLSRDATPWEHVTSLPTWETMYNVLSRVIDLKVNILTLGQVLVTSDPNIIHCS